MTRATFLLLGLLLGACESAIVIGSERSADGGIPCATPLVVDRLSIGANGGCAIRQGTVYCWGYGGAGAIGNGRTDDQPSPVAIPSTDAFTEIGVSGYGACALRSDSKVFCWGENFGGALADGTDQNSATMVETIGGVVELAMGQGFVLARSSDGSLTSWGSNVYGQLGIGPATVGTAVRVETPVPSSNFRTLGAGDHHACAIDAVGTPYCAGDNTNGQLAMSGAGLRDTFTAIATNIAFAEISAGHDRTCAITTTGRLYCWGTNYPTWITSPLGAVATPTPVGTESDYTQVSVGYQHACALRDNGRLFCWGSNADDALGFHGGDQANPVEVTPGTHYAFVSASFGVTCAIREADSVAICWGRNEGNLGRGADRSTAPGAVCLP